MAMATAKLDGVAIDPAVLLGDLDTAQALDACVWLCALLAEHAVLDTGPVLLQVVGRVAGWVDAGGQIEP